MDRKRFSHRVDLYAHAVTGGTVAAGPLVRLACARHLRDRTQAASKKGHPGGYRFDEKAANHVMDFFEQVLRLPDTKDEHGDPLPFLLTPWQAFVVGSLFGWRSPDGYRRFRDAYIEVGKGNGKSPMAAGIGLYGLMMDGENAAEIYSAATAREQAKILWDDAKRMIECSPDLSAVVHVSVGNLAYAPTYSYFRPLSSEHRQLDGKRPHMALLDEVHEHPNALVVNKLRAGAKGRKNFLAVEITNSGFDRTSVCWQHHEHSRKVLDGIVDDDRWFAFVAGLDEGDDPLADESCWLKANPNLGTSIQREYLLRQVENARNIPAETNTVLRLNFCVWTQSHARAFDMPKWHQCAALTFTDDDLVGVPGYGGLDLGQTDDFAAWVRVWDLGDRVAVKCRFWLPQAALDKYPDRPYPEWQRAGLLEVTEGNTTDMDVIEQAVLDDARASGVHEIAFDKRFAQQMALHLQGHGLTMVDTPQGFALNEAIRRLSTLIAEVELAHQNHAILTWMADNTVIRTGRNREVRIDKDAAKEKIDGIAALVMALSRLIAQEPQSESVYDTRGVYIIGGGQ